MKKKINYGRQYIDKLDANLVTKSLKENLITTGNYVHLFEKKIESFFFPLTIRCILFPRFLISSAIKIDLLR